MPQKNKGVSQKNQNKNFIKKRITKYFGGSDPMNELVTNKIFFKLALVIWPTTEYANSLLDLFLRPLCLVSSFVFFVLLRMTKITRSYWVKLL